VPVIVAIVADAGGAGTGVAITAGAGDGSAPVAPAGIVIISIQRIAAAHAPRWPAKFVMKCLDINGKNGAGIAAAIRPMIRPLGSLVYRHLSNEKARVRDASLIVR
jgi:hypothetical protein